MEKSVEILTSYVPALIAKHFTENPQPLSEPFEKHFPAAVFFADISGFTRLAERLAEHGIEGAEQLTTLLNDYFGRIIGMVGSHGGDVVKFAGDALFAIWYNDEDDLEDAVTRATLCGLEVTKVLNEYDVNDNLPSDLKINYSGDDNEENKLLLYLRVSIGAGDIIAAAVGGERKRWEFIIAGDPLKQVGVASDIAKAGEVILSPQAWQIAEATVSGKIHKQNPELFLAETVLHPPRMRPLSEHTIDENLTEGLRGFVSGAILNRMDIVGEENWLAEHRRISVIFMQVTNLDFSQPDAVANLQRIMKEAQRTLYQYEGSVRQLIEDDKGTVFIAVLGLPPYTHQDDPALAVLAAMAMQHRLKKIGFSSRVGVTTGNAFCGPIGISLRREYAMVGSIVNLAARLMGATKKLDVDILCDEATYQSAKNRVAFAPMPPISLKNIAEPVVTYSALLDDSQVESSLRPLVGRKDEREQLSRYLQALQAGESHIILIEGKSGIGKSRLVKDLIEQANAHDIFNISGTATSIEKSTPYHVWNDIFSKLFDTKVNARTTMRRESVVKKLMKNKEIMQFLPLLNSVLHLELPENSETVDMTRSMKMRSLRNLMLQIIETAVDKSPAVLVLEDVQWMDSTSWDFTYAVSQQLNPLLLVFVGRPLDGPEQEARQLLTKDLSTNLSLAPLSKDETTQLVSFCLEVTTIAPEVTDLIYEQSKGNPFFSEELAYALRDGKNIIEEEGIYRLDKKSTHSISPTGELHINVPDTLQGILTSRIDRLDPEVELTLKTASVIGTRFNERILRDIFPFEAHKSKIHDYLNILDDLDFIVAPRSQGETEYHFHQTITQEAAYKLIPFTQRRELHKSVALWYEKNYVYDLSPYYQFLAHHWHRAEDEKQFFEYSEKAGEQSLQNAAYQEAINIFEQAIEQISDTSSVHTAYRLAHWEGAISQSYWGLSNFAKAQKHAHKVLQWLGYEIPSADELQQAIYSQMFEQAKHRLMPKRYMGTAENILYASEAARAFRILQEIHYFNNESTLANYCGLRVLNLAETIGEKHPELARAYANFYVGLSLRQQNRLARMYKRLALSTMEKLNKSNISAPVLTRLGMYDLVKAQWTSARAFVEKAASLYKKLEDKRSWSDTQLLLGFMSYFQADFWEGGSIFDEVAINAQRISNADHRVLGLTGYALHLLALDKIRLAMSQLQQAKPHWDNASVQDATSFFSKSLFALATLRTGHLPRTFDAAKEALHILPKAYRRIDPASFFGTQILIEVYLELSNDEAYQAEAQTHLIALIERLQLFKKHFSATIPYINLWEGRYLVLMGNADQSQKLFEKALKQAQTISLTWIEGRAYFELAKINSDPNEQADNLAMALETLESIQAAYDVDQVRQYIRQSESTS